MALTDHCHSQQLLLLSVCSLTRPLLRALPLPPLLATNPATASVSRSSHRFSGLSTAQDLPSVHTEYSRCLLNSSLQQRIPSIHITSHLTAPLHRRTAPSHIHNSPPPFTSPHTNTLHLTLLTLPQDPRRAPPPHRSRLTPAPSCGSQTGPRVH